MPLATNEVRASAVSNRFVISESMPSKPNPSRGSRDSSKRHSVSSSAREGIAAGKTKEKVSANYQLGSTKIDKAVNGK